MDSIKKSVEIEGVIVQPLQEISDHRGSVLKMLRNDSYLFKKFGEVYFSEIHSGIIKAWKRHKQQTQNLTVLLEKVRLVIYDNRPTSSTNGKVAEYEFGRLEDYRLIHIPSMLWYGFQAIGDRTSLIANCTDEPHDPEESESLPTNSNLIPYHWKS
jgi:dTDP-4-dehydrorhamnose 3,5-epimerase